LNYPCMLFLFKIPQKKKYVICRKSMDKGGKKVGEKEENV